MPEVNTDSNTYEKNHKKKVLRAKEQKKKLKLKKLAKRIKKVSNKQKPILQKQLDDLSQKNKKKEEDRFEILLNTIHNKNKNLKKERKKKMTDQKLNDKLVKEGVIPGKVRMCSKHRLDAHELTDLPIGIFYILIFFCKFLEC